jgi:6-phosphofructokinase 1
MNNSSPPVSRIKNFDVQSLGVCTRPNPIHLAGGGIWTSDTDIMAQTTNLNAIAKSLNGQIDLRSFEIAGPREKIYFEPTELKAAIVTCGGLCPGLNTVIRALVMQLWHRYGCRYIEGIRGGYHGLAAVRANDFYCLTPDDVEDIHMRGGTILGTSRGTPPTTEIVDSLVRKGIQVLFTIGGDGTLRGAAAIAAEIQKRGEKISVVGIPKTIDNDIPWVRRTFGFETAVSVAVEAVTAAHTEAESVYNGIGLVKLMGRDSGYIAANATLASGDVNFCLVPEVDFELDGPNGLIEVLVKRLENREHAVIVVAEGAGQRFFKTLDSYKEERDASGNIKLGDIGVFLREQIKQKLHARGVTHTLKYIDPSYIIRASAANSGDQLFCARLAQNAVHAAMAGKTGLMIGYWHGRMTHVPFHAVEGRQKINPGGELWFNVLETTGQPGDMGIAI